MQFALIQFNPTIGDVINNYKRIVKFYHQALKQGADCVIFPEMSLLGYPAMDLLWHGTVHEQLWKCFMELKGLVSKPLIIGGPILSNSNRLEDIINSINQKKPTPIPSSLNPAIEDHPGIIYNAALIYEHKSLKAVTAKSLIPNYDVFDEQRYFTPAPQSQHPIITINKLKVGISICEDLWFNHCRNYHSYATNPEKKLKGADLIVNLSASPYDHYKPNLRQTLLKKVSIRLNRPIVYVNQVGATEELIFDGASTVYVGSNLKTELTQFKEKILYWDYVPIKNGPLVNLFNDKKIKPNNETTLNNETYELTSSGDFEQNLFKALTFGLKDIFKKQGFKQTLIGLSGGIDSALVATIAVKALGRDKVLGITLPGPFSSKGSVQDSYNLAKNLGIKLETIDINEMVKVAQNSLKGFFQQLPFDTAEENIQARSRGLILMALSNKFSRILLTTGNKSELAVGYCTLYGDLNGSIAVIGDVYKTEVFSLCRWINRKNEIIPWDIINKAPSAELGPNQKDTDTLPPYKVLDTILKATIENLMSSKQIAKNYALNLDLIKTIQKQVHQNEYKRFQAPPVLKVSPKAFGIGRRYPLVKSAVHLF